MLSVMLVQVLFLKWKLLYLWFENIEHTSLTVVIRTELHDYNFWVICLVIRKAVFTFFMGSVYL